VAVIVALALMPAGGISDTARGTGLSGETEAGQSIVSRAGGTGVGVGDGVGVQVGAGVTVGAGVVGNAVGTAGTAGAPHAVSTRMTRMTGTTNRLCMPASLAAKARKGE